MWNTPWPKLAHADLLIRWHVRNRLRGDHQRDDMLMKNLVVSQIVRERRRSASWLRRHEHGCARNARGPRLDDSKQKVFYRHGTRRQTRCHDFTSCLPGRHQREQQTANDERQPPTVRDLQNVRAKKRQIDRQKDAGDGDATIGDHFQRSVATTCSSTAVITIVSVTAMP